MAYNKEDIASRRLVSQRIDSSDFDRARDATAWLVGIQAQDYAGAKWSIGLRAPSLRDADVEFALREQAIVRTWAMRGTLHFVAAADVNWLLTLLAPRLIAKNARRYRQLELDEETMVRSSALLARALENEDLLDRQALGNILEIEGISTHGQRLFYILQRAGLERLICQGTAEKNNPLYQRLRIENKGDLTPEEALRELAARYFTSQGPATLDDFIWWSGLSAADARQGLESAGGRLKKEALNGRDYWLADSAADEDSELSAVYLLPSFDAYLLSYRDRSASIASKDVEAWSRGKAMFSPSIVRGGHVIGLWQRAIKGNSVLMTPEFFGDLTPGEEEALQAAAAKYGRFLNKKAIVERPALGV